MTLELFEAVAIFFVADAACFMQFVRNADRADDGCAFFLRGVAQALVSGRKR